VLIKNIKGKISKIIEGVFKKERNIGYEKCSFISLKNSISSKIPTIKIILKKRKKIFQNELKKIFNKNLIYVFIFFLNLIFV
tara:strand:- start:1126 stop:1371 length:246 start_codon:yes stop_codon:yes gene_type:complete